jgi:hypothetical protein
MSTSTHFANPSAISSPKEPCKTVAATCQAVILSGAARERGHAQSKSLPRARRGDPMLVSATLGSSGSSLLECIGAAKVPTLPSPSWGAVSGTRIGFPEKVPRIDGRQHRREKAAQTLAVSRTSKRSHQIPREPERIDRPHQRRGRVARHGRVRVTKNRGLSPCCQDNRELALGHWLLLWKFSRHPRPKAVNAKEYNR